MSKQQPKETKLGTNTGSFPEGGSAAPEYDFLNVDEQTGLLIVCKTCQKPIFDIRKHRNPKGQRDDDDRVLTLPEEYGRDDGLFRMCNRCSNHELPGSYHTDDSNDYCDPSVFASSRHRKETSFAFGDDAVMKEHQEGGSTFDDKKDVYSHKHRGYQRNCSICGCVVYHPFGDVEEYYCSKHNKYDRAWQD